MIEVKTDFPIWVEALANGATPMCGALARATELISAWIGEHPRGFPPIVLNLTDGEANDGDPIASARQLTQLRTDDGAVLLFNLHISDQGGTPITFPAELIEPAGRLRAQSLRHVKRTTVAHARVCGQQPLRRSRGQPGIRLQFRHCVSCAVPRHRYARAGLAVIP